MALKILKGRNFQLKSLVTKSLGHHVATNLRNVLCAEVLLGDALWNPG